MTVPIVGLRESHRSERDQQGQDGEVLSQVFDWYGNTWEVGMCVSVYAVQVHGLGGDAQEGAGER
jgi:hypothetical protein